jgi:DNA/RNA-binding domain of Phe-tRNA-synthetase-like protein
LENVLELHVRKIVQTASGGSHVTIFDAEIELTPSDVRVEVLSVSPENAAQEDVDAARAAIQRGAEQVLQPLQQGSVIRVWSLVIHPIDFKPQRFEQYTTEELARVLGEANTSPDHGDT